jgi:prevent-host-death family protein
MAWSIAQAKQRFSEVVKQAAKEPQLICNRGTLVAAVINAEDFKEFEKSRASAHRRTLADEFAELRKILEEEDYELGLPPRTTRPSAFVQTLEQEDRSVSS